MTLTSLPKVHQKSHWFKFRSRTLSQTLWLFEFHCCLNMSVGKGRSAAMLPIRSFGGCRTRGEFAIMHRWQSIQALKPRAPEIQNRAISASTSTSGSLRQIARELTNLIQLWIQIVFLKFWRIGKVSSNYSIWTIWCTSIKMSSI